MSSFTAQMPSKFKMTLYTLILVILPIIWMTALAGAGLLVHSDWFWFFFPALENYTSGLSPYAIDGIFNPPWFFLLFAPFEWIGYIPSALIIEFSTLMLLYITVLWLTDTRKQTLIALILLSPLNLYVLNQIWLAQVDVILTFSGILLTLSVARKTSNYVWYAGLALVLLSLKPPSGLWIAVYIFWLVPIKQWWKMLIIPLCVGAMSLLLDFNLLLEFITVMQTRLGYSERALWDVTIFGFTDYYGASQWITVSIGLLVLAWIVYLWRKNENHADRIMLMTIAGLLLNAYVGWHHLVLLFAISVPLLLRRSQHPALITTLVLIGFVPLIRYLFLGADILPAFVVLILITVTPPHEK